MPNDPGPSSWLEGQYRKFLEGVDQVGTPNAARIARSQARVRVEPAKTPQISIPAWDDVIRTGPRRTVTEEEYAIHREFRRRGLPSPLAPEVEQAIADRKAMAQRIRNSAIPEYQRGVATMMTAVDNVQDAALTLAVAGRITATALGRFGSWIAPAVATLSTVAKMLSWLGLALVLFGILYALACQGPRDAISQARANALAGYLFKGVRSLIPRARGIPTPFPAAGSKGRHGVATFGVPSGREVSNRRASRWAKALPSFGEILQAGQVAYDHLGYGLALGAIIGMSSETAYAEARRAQGETVTVRSPAVNHVLARILSSRLASLSRGALWHRWQCARALAAAPFILRDPETWGDELYGLTWITVYASLEPLMQDTEGLPWREPVITHLATAEWSPLDVHDRVSQGVLEELELGAGEPVWPLEGAPRTITAERLVVDVGKEIGEACARWLEADPMDPWRRLVAELAMATTERLWYWLEGATDWPAWKLSPASAVWESLFLADRWPILSDPPELVMAAWAASEQWCRDHDRQMIPPEELERIWTEAGSPLLRLYGGPGPVALEHFVPHDPDTGSTAGAAFGHNLDEARRRLAALLEQEGPTRPQDETSRGAR